MEKGCAVRSAAPVDYCAEVPIKGSLKINGHYGFPLFPSSSSKPICPPGKDHPVKLETGGSKLIIYGVGESVKPHDLIQIRLSDLMECELVGGFVHFTSAKEINKFISSAKNKDTSFIKATWAAISPLKQDENITRYAFVKGFTRIQALKNLVINLS